MFSNTGQEKGNQHGSRENDLQNWLNMTLHETLYTQSIHVVTGVEHVHPPVLTMTCLVVWSLGSLAASSQSIHSLVTKSLSWVG